MWFRRVFSEAGYRDPIIKNGIEKHQSRSKIPLNDMDKVRDNETLLDHLVKLTTGAYAIIITLMFLVEN
jgi:hypothetical protein